MGLISTDELKRWLDGFKETDNISPVYMRTLIDSQPTVEAIPVAFIEEQMRNHYERAHNSALAIQQRNLDRAIALADLINDWHDWYDIWEKENE